MGGTIIRQSRLMAALLLMAGILVVAAPVEAQTSGGSYFQLNGTPGDYITQGNDILIDASDEATFSPSVNFDKGISVAVEVRNNGVFVARWQADFAAPNDVPLAEGDAFSATRFPFQEAGTAGLSVAGDGRGCNTLTGDFVVNEISVVGDEVLLFDADFSQSCDGGAVMTGSVRFGPAVDTTPPQASAELEQVGRIRGSSSDFIVGASCTDDNEGVELVSAEINGVPVQNGERVQLVTSNREKDPKYHKGELKIQSASIVLTVTCMDAAGNVGAGTAMPVYKAG